MDVRISFDENDPMVLALANVAQALYKLGNADAATPMGGLEALGKQLGDVLQQAGDTIAEAIERREE